MIFFIRRTVIFFLVFEVIIFFVIYCFGPKSIRTLYDVQRHESIMQQQIGQLRQEIGQLQQQIEENQTLFAKEKIARETLLMKRENEKVYFVKH